VPLDTLVAEIKIVAFNFAPTGFAECNGQLLPITQNTALFSLLGTTYGGNGESLFGLPDLQGSAVMHPGDSHDGLSERLLGEIGGSSTSSLLLSEIPLHAHSVQGNALNASTGVPSATAVIARGFGGNAYKASPFAALVPMAPEALTPAGGDLPHNNLMPYLVLKYVIALQGLFPARPT
jgi:microcystin-dependent protein